MKRFILLLMMLGLVWLASAVQTNSQAGSSSSSRLHWYKGNTHTHTLNSDGDSTPEDVVRWYRENGYQFLVLTDHNFLTSVGGLNALHGADERFLVIKGEEVTDKFGEKPIHVNGLDVAELVTPQGGDSVVETLQRNVDAIRKVQGVPHINHPSFGWAITGDELRQVENNKLLEIFNGHPQVNNEAGGGMPSVETAWDHILMNGKLIYGIAVDDAHVFKRPWDRNAARPGQGWVVVRAERLEVRGILEAMERGDFYASTGVELSEVQTNDQEVSITIKEDRTAKYRVQFIGKGGKLLKEEVASPARYKIRGDEGYVRGKVLDSNGRVAWTQPVSVRSH
ncbi:MAG: CehA/McbA family metallohydrolase [Acidobacteria bacterium]|nr:CehA/McbA family metallohydrolase [Acidobacteriota bacterium]MCI0628714.1 CehA/McbA family metallohydrolase [Acidobacteriota bacterium]MCI0718194.1 CehA/McbA family metallohydrolase [Acidobacteriota bacterium]